MGYNVKEIFLSLQGEGAQSGRLAVFCRFTGCNLWSGREADRATALCDFCDTDFVGSDGVGGGKFADTEALVRAIEALWPEDAQHRFVVLTGGEPLLQVDPPLLAELHQSGFTTAVETNGTIAAPDGIDWLCVSPKATNELKQRSGNELKLVYYQRQAPPEHFTDLAFDHFFLQPMDGPQTKEYTEAAIDYCRHQPQWRLSLQIHKLLGIP